MICVRFCHQQQQQQQCYHDRHHRARSHSIIFASVRCATMMFPLRQKHQKRATRKESEFIKHGAVFVLCCVCFVKQQTYTHQLIAHERREIHWWLAPLVGPGKGHPTICRQHIYVYSSNTFTHTYNTNTYM